jgi:hypothetical protein
VLFSWADRARPDASAAFFGREISLKGIKCYATGGIHVDGDEQAARKGMGIRGAYHAAQFGQCR